MDDTSAVRPNMHSGSWHPSAPVLLRDVWTLAITYKADPKALRRWLPPGLEPHPDGRVEMTMYEVPNSRQTSGFGAFDLTYGSCHRPSRRRPGAACPAAGSRS